MPIETDLKEVLSFSELHFHPNGMASITFRKQRVYADGRVDDAGLVEYTLEKNKVDAVLVGNVDVNLTLGQNMLLAIESAVSVE